jgi:FtsP/CotA-like multicopper oxidase with cupredoxin domain
VAGLPQELIVIRDNPAVNPPPIRRPKTHRPSDDDGAADLSVNYVPVGGPAFIPAEYTMKPGEKQFWRVLNASAVTILDLQLLYDKHAQPFQLIALDGVPLDSQNGSGKGRSQTRTHILIPPAGRAEFIVTAPSEDVKEARLVTRRVNSGPDGDPDPQRPLFNITASATADSSIHGRPLPSQSGPPPAPKFANLAEARPTTTRTLYFSEDENFFYITVAGQTPKPYDMSDPPAIVTTQGAVEDWIVENHSRENHEFHMHQIHFELMERNGKPVPVSERQVIDTVDIPYWTGTGPYPSIKVRMDFRGPTVGDFVYHCHILDHEDGGMMAIIRVLPRTSNGGAGISKK